MKDFELSKSVDPVGLMAKNPPNDGPVTNALWAPVAAIPAAVVQWLAVVTVAYLWLGVKKGVAAWE